MKVDYHVDIDVSAITSKIGAVLNDPKTMTEIHEAFARHMHKYIPRKEGILAGSAEATPEYVRYPGPYAHYQYEGEIYGPNLIGWFDFITPGWISMRNVKKSPTGRELGKPGSATLKPQFGENKEDIEWDFGYTTPGTGHHWDKKMMEQEGDLFRQEVAQIIARRAREIYG